MGTKEEAGKARLLYRLVKLFDYFLLGDNKYKKVGSHSSWLPPADANVTGINWFKSFTTFISNVTML